jgi:hypothetical protein
MLVKKESINITEPNEAHATGSLDEPENNTLHGLFL